MLGHQIVETNTQTAMMIMDHGQVPRHASQYLIGLQSEAFLKLRALSQVIPPPTDAATPPISDK